MIDLQHYSVYMQITNINYFNLIHKIELNDWYISVYVHYKRARNYYTAYVRTYSKYIFE